MNILHKVNLKSCVIMNYYQEYNQLVMHFYITWLLNAGLHKISQDPDKKVSQKTVKGCYILVIRGW